MADITMCSGDGCPVKAKCYRHTAPADPIRQSYFLAPPIKDGECDLFWDTTKWHFPHPIASSSLGTTTDGVGSK